MDPTQLQPGYRLDRYELLCPLAYGGMASVWLARFGGRLGFERMVVIKMILPQFSQDPRFQEMFLDEARIASKIEHSNVARILDVGEHQENYFIVMEWVDGDSLSKIMRASEQRKERLPWGVALRICADAAAGLHAAHELKERDGTHLGVVHRDVSPQNILVANNGATMIIDFGVAKARDRVSQDTSAGQLKGKIRYMAPEQALGRAIDHRADVWAIGAMLYEMFTGLPPYDGPNEVATLHKLTSGQRPPPLPRTLPEAIRAVIERALGYEPDQRFGSALELNLALEGAMVEINEPTTAAIVSHYTGQLLADRKAARKKAVDAALDAARKREVPGARPSIPSALPTSPASWRSLPGTGNDRGSGPGAVAQSGSGSGVANTQPLPHQQQAVRSGTLVLDQQDGGQTEALVHPALGALGESPSAASALSLSELPSAASNGTIGPSAVEYPLNPLLDESARRRRYIAAAAMGVSFAAGLVGAVLIISSALAKPDDPKPSAPPPEPAAIAPANTAATAATVATATTELDPAPEPSTPPAATPTAPAPTATPSSTGTVIGASPTATATTSSQGHGRDAPTSTPHKPPPPPPPPPKPKPTAPASTKHDWGF